MAISSGNSKIGKVPNVSLIPIKDCGNCSLCKKDCYALKSFRMYPNVRESWKQNSKLAHRNRSKYYEMISAYLSKHMPRYFRWHVAGDILDQNYLEAMKDTAIEFPETRFLAFTKMHSLDYSNLPSNLTVIFSRWPDDSCDNDEMPMAWVQDGNETRIPKDAIECLGSCENCMMCWSLPTVGKDVYFNIH